MKKTMFRISLFSGSNPCCDKAILAAALCNGQYHSLGVDEIKKHAEQEKKDNPESNQNTSIELIRDNLLHIDTKVDGEYKTVCIIEQVEVFELVEEAVTE